MKKLKFLLMIFSLTVIFTGSYAYEQNQNIKESVLKDLHGDLMRCQPISPDQPKGDDYKAWYLFGSTTPGASKDNKGKYEYIWQKAREQRLGRNVTNGILHYILKTPRREEYNNIMHFLHKHKYFEYCDLKFIILNNPSGDGKTWKIENAVAGWVDGFCLDHR